MIVLVILLILVQLSNCAVLTTTPIMNNSEASASNLVTNAEVTNIITNTNFFSTNIVATTNMIATTNMVATTNLVTTANIVTTTIQFNDSGINETTIINVTEDFLSSTDLF